MAQFTGGDAHLRDPLDDLGAVYRQRTSAIMSAVRTIALLALLLTACSRPVDEVAEGRRLYLAYGCAACHGEAGDGNGPAASLSHFKPRDLRNVNAFSGAKTAEGIAGTIAFGIADGRTGMPAYPDVPRHERERMAKWILSLGQGVSVTEAWIRQPAGATAAAYLTLRNAGSREVALVAVSSDAAAFIEIHESRERDGMMTMRKVERVAIAPRGTATLAPGGLHLMLINLERPLRTGDAVPLTLQFDDGTSITAAATVRPQ